MADAPRMSSPLAAATLDWQRAGLAEEEGLSGIMFWPTDKVTSGPDRNVTDMMHDLRWETALGEKYPPP